MSPGAVTVTVTVPATRPDCHGACMLSATVVELALCTSIVGMAGGVSTSTSSPGHPAVGSNTALMISIGEKHGISPAQVALRWLVQQNISIVTAADNPDSEYIKKDIDLFSFELSAPEMEQLVAL